VSAFLSQKSYHIKNLNIRDGDEMHGQKHANFKFEYVPSEYENFYRILKSHSLSPPKFIGHCPSDEMKCLRIRLKSAEYF